MAENKPCDVVGMLTAELTNDIMIRTSLSETFRYGVEATVQRHLEGLARLAAAKQLVIEMLLERHQADSIRFKKIEEHLKEFEKALNP